MRIRTKLAILAGVLLLAVPTGVLSAVIFWEMDCFGVVLVTPISGGNHVVCEEVPTTTPTPTPTATPEPPIGDGGLILHYDARIGILQDAGGSLSNVGDPVGEWQDQSGNEVHLTYLNSLSRRATLVIGPYVEFDGLSDVMYSASPFISDDEGTIIMLFRFFDPGDKPLPTILRSQRVANVSAGEERIAWDYGVAAGEFRFNYRTADNDVYIIDDTIIKPDGLWHIVSMAWDANTGTMNVRIDQVLFGTAGGLIPGNHLPDEMVLAAKTKGGAHKAGITFAEIRIFDGKLLDAEISNIETAIVTDWELP